MSRKMTDPAVSTLVLHKPGGSPSPLIVCDDIETIHDGHCSVAASSSHFTEYCLDNGSTTSEEFDTGLNIDDDSVSSCLRRDRNELDDSATVPTAVSQDAKHELVPATTVSNKDIVRIEPPMPVPTTPISKRATSSPLPVSIVKVESKSEPRYIDNHRRRWKSLPAVDLDQILQDVKSLSDSCDASPLKHASSSLEIGRNSNSNNSVSFDSICIRFYAQMVGDNPSVTYGPPISLDWDYEEMEAIAVDEYERNRPKRRNVRQMVLSHYEVPSKEPSFVAIWRVGGGTQKGQETSR